MKKFYNYLSLIEDLLKNFALAASVALCIEGNVSILIGIIALVTLVLTFVVRTIIIKLKKDSNPSEVDNAD